MIDTKELRQLAQAATPGPWKTGQYLGSLRQFVIHTDVGDKGRGSDVAFTSSAFGSDETVANARLISAANPSVISELLDRLEAAEKERDDLRAKIDAMEQQEPVAWLHETRRDSDVVTSAVKHVWGKVAVGSLAAYSIPLYLAPGAQPTPIEQDTSVRKAWARFSNELHRSPNAPYPGMSEAFEQHFSQSFTDREWRAESATWAAAWKAAKRHEAQAQPAPSAPEGWLRAIDEALIVAHIGMANADDTYAQAKSKLDTLISLHADIATDPAVNGGWKLVPTAESRHPGIHKMLNALHAVDNTPGASEWESYAAFLAATPEAKP